MVYSLYRERGTESKAAAVPLEAGLCTIERMKEMTLAAQVLLRKS
ncbi:hypothetical protein [Paenibacillus nanensis]|nr:hypothetical protein [Paenibacillus nanensis]